MRAVLAGLLAAFTAAASGVTYPDVYHVEIDGVVIIFEKGDTYVNGKPVYLTADEPVLYLWNSAEWAHAAATTPDEYWRIGPKTDKRYQTHFSVKGAVLPESGGWYSATNNAALTGNQFKIRGLIILLDLFCMESWDSADSQWSDSYGGCMKLGSKFCMYSCTNERYVALNTCTYADSSCGSTVDVVNGHLDSGKADLPSCGVQPLGDGDGPAADAAAVSYPDAWNVKQDGSTVEYSIVEGLFRNGRPIWRLQNPVTYIYSEQMTRMIGGQGPPKTNNVWRMGCSFLNQHVTLTSAYDVPLPTAAGWRDYKTWTLLGDKLTIDAASDAVWKTAAGWDTYEPTGSSASGASDNGSSASGSSDNGSSASGSSGLDHIVDMASLQAHCRANRDNCIACNGKWSNWLGKCRDGKMKEVQLRRCPSFRKNAELCAYLKCTPRVARNGKNKCKGGEKSGRKITLKNE